MDDAERTKASKCFFSVKLHKKKDNCQRRSTSNIQGRGSRERTSQRVVREDDRASCSSSLSTQGGRCRAIGL